MNCFKIKVNYNKENDLNDIFLLCLKDDLYKYIQMLSCKKSKNEVSL